MKKTARNETGSQDTTIWTQLVLPLAAIMRKDLRELVMGFGMQAIGALLEQERIALCGPLYKHDRNRKATRGGTTRGQLSLGGRKVVIPRPRAVDLAGNEIALETWTQLQNNDPLEKRAVEQMIVGVATRKYARSLEDVPEDFGESGTSKSAVSRRFVHATSAKLAEWMSRPLGELDICAVFIDGIHFSEHVVLVALGVDVNGTKHALGLWEGATENGVACKALLDDLVTRGLDPKRKRLFVIDGARGIRSAIRDAFGKRALVQRCQKHKMENVISHLPKSKHAAVRAALRQAYKSTRVPTAKRLLNNLIRSLEGNHPGAAASLREGLDETLTVMGLGLPRALTRSFSTTNPIENLNGSLRAVARRVKRWRNGEMILRWAAVGVLEAARGFRRLKGHRDMSKLLAVLDDERHVDAEDKAA